MKLHFTIVLLFLVVFAEKASAQVIDTSFQKLIKSYPMKYEHNLFSGTGWDIIQKEILKAQFVLVGETHGHVEIPLLTKEIAKLFKPEVFVGETDPYTIKEIERLLDNKKPDANYFTSNPWGLAFFSMQSEFELVQYLHDQKIKLWGLDQIHLFSSGRFFEMLALETKNKETKLRINNKAKQFSANDLPLLSSGKYDSLSIFKTQPNTIDSLIKAFKNESPYAKKMLDDYKLSTEIYSTGSHLRRINLMKRNLINYSLGYLSFGKPLPKILFKLGAMHTFRNESLNIVFDIGNLAANLAEAQNNTTLHILAVGKAGTANRMNSSVESKAIQPYTILDDGLDYFKPFLDLVPDDGPVVIDLRPLRKKIDAGQLKIENINLARVILGNEFLVVFGKVTGSTFKK